MVSSLLNKIIRYLREALFVLNEGWRRVFVLIIVFMLMGLVEIVGVGVVGVYISILSGENVPVVLNEFIDISNVEGSIQYVGLLLVFVFVVKSVLSYGLNYYIARYGLHKQTELRMKLLYVYSFMPYEDLVHIKSSKIINEIMNYASNFSLNIAPQLFRCVAELITVIGLIAYLFYYSPIAVITMAIFFVMIMVLYDLFIKNNIAKSGKISNHQNEVIMAEVHHAVDANREMRVLGVTDYFVGRVRKQQEIIQRHQLHVEALQLIPKYMFEIGMVLSVVIITMIFIQSSIEGAIGALGVFVVAGLRLMPAAIIITRSINIIRASRHVLTSLYEIMSGDRFYKFSRLSERVMSNNKEEHSHEGSKLKSIRLRDVYYKYSDDSGYVLNGLSLNVNKGDSVGIVGPSGSGKSTLISIVLGLIKPTDGSAETLIKDKKMDLYGIDDLCAYIPQETFIVDDSIAVNVALGIDEELIDAQQLKYALELAQIDFVNLDGDLFNGSLGEGGVLLSGGQRQRIALARAFYHKRDVIVLDEVTSALDKQTEQKIIQTISGLRGEKTIITVTHSQDLLEACNRVYRLEGGLLVEHLS